MTGSAETPSDEPLAGAPSDDPVAGAPPGPEAAAAHTYESAAARIEEVIRRLDSGDAGLRETLDLVREGRELVEWCASELEAVGRGLEELRLEELVERLEAGGSSASGGSPPDGA